MKDGSKIFGKTSRNAPTDKERVTMKRIHEGRSGGRPGEGRPGWGDLMFDEKYGNGTPDVNQRDVMVAEGDCFLVRAYRHPRAPSTLRRSFLAFPPSE